MPTPHTPKPGIANPYGTYAIRPTDTGLEFQVSVRDPRNPIILAGLVTKSIFLLVVTYSGFWSFVGAAVLLFALDAGLYTVLWLTKLNWIEVRPDGFTITTEIDDADSARFFDRRPISARYLDFDHGLSFQYGIYPVQATPGFANLREYEIFAPQFEAAIARIQHQQNMNQGAST